MRGLSLPLISATARLTEEVEAPESDCIDRLRCRFLLGWEEISVDSKKFFGEDAGDGRAGMKS